MICFAIVQDFAVLAFPLFIRHFVCCYCQCVNLQASNYKICLLKKLFNCIYDLNVLSYYKKLRKETANLLGQYVLVAH
ncbi:unnamed protein product [Coffea canephora]|uniref:Secreted protein n=1 Tax=Coffea canephora TaxID=49390 RepID=A0A068V5M8_COFCA|nr:unnamed protein product [Coffea canephora]